MRKRKKAEIVNIREGERNVGGTSVGKEGCMDDVW